MVFPMDLLMLLDAVGAQDRGRLRVDGLGFSGNRLRPYRALKGRERSRGLSSRCGGLILADRDQAMPLVGRCRRPGDRVREQPAWVRRRRVPWAGCRAFSL